MSTKVYHGDEWKSCDATEQPAHRTRADEQAHIDTEYGTGRISRHEWNRRTDELSEPTKWTAKGRVA